MIKEIFTGNILTKFMALVMAVALWLYAINRQTEDLTEVVKLNVSVPEGITVLEQSTEEITVHLRGPQSILESVEGMIKRPENPGTVCRKRIAKRNRRSGEANGSHRARTSESTQRRQIGICLSK